MTVKGENLRPYMCVSADNQQAVDFLFRSTTQVEAPFYNLPPGQYDIIIYDPGPGALPPPECADGAAIRRCPPPNIVAVGAFGNLDAAGVAKITPGLSLGDLGEVIAVGKPLPDLTNVFASPGLVGEPIANALRLPAVVRFRCYVRAQQGRPSCSWSRTPSSRRRHYSCCRWARRRYLFRSSRFAARTRSRRCLSRFASPAPPSVLSLIKAGDVDLGATTNELAAMATVNWRRPVARQSDTAAEIEVRLMAQLQRVDGVWWYDAAPLRSGSAIHLRNKRYEARGIVIDVPSAEKGAAAGR